MGEAALNSKGSIALPYLREIIEETLRGVVERIPPHSDLYAACEYTIFPGGKRVRPLLSLALAADLGADLNLVKFPACALELLHAASLIHDDLPALDNDDLRRGKPSCHRQFGEGTAVLVADYLTALAFHLSTLITPDRSSILSVPQLIAHSYMLVCRGQLLDLHSHQIKGLRELYALKTGALFSCALQLAALLGAGSKQLIETAAKLGVELGIAFQIIDDYVDLFGTDQQRGRGESSDLKNKKVTFFSVSERAQGERELEAQCVRVRELLGALEACPEFVNGGASLTKQSIERMIGVRSRALP